MFMPLVANEDGTPLFVKQTGVTLSAGDIVGILTLDDPSRVRHAKPFEGQLPAMGLPSSVGNKPAQRFGYLLETLRNILKGYDNQSILQSAVKELVEVLRQPELPYGEANAILSTLSGRMPAKLETSVRATIDAAQGKGMEFPALRISKQIENYIAENVQPQTRSNFLATLGGLDTLVTRYSRGLKDHEFYIIASLLVDYLNTEQLFSGRSDDAVLMLRDTYKDDPDMVAGLVFSHSRAAAKNNLMMLLLEHVKKEGSQSALELHFETTLKDLANLDNKTCAKVALKAREVLIACQMPNLGERSAQLEHILKSAVSASHYGEVRSHGRQPDVETLKELVDSRYTVYDVLPVFFAHPDEWVALAALEAYVRRAYRAYNIDAVDYFEGDILDNEPICIRWTFRNPSDSGPSKAMNGSHSRVQSYSDLASMVDTRVDGSLQETFRYGVMYSANTLGDLEASFMGALSYIKPSSISQASPLNVMNAVLRLEDAQQDLAAEEWLKTFVEIANLHSSDLRKRAVRRVSFMVCRLGQYPSYFTLRPTAGNEWQESSAIRDIEPALAYQLELNRMSNFNLEPCGVENHQIHVYYATAKENPSDARFFVRALVRPGRLRGGVSMADYLVSETE